MNIVDVCVIQYPGQVEAGNITFRQPGNDILIDTWNVAGVSQPTEAYLLSLIPTLEPIYLLNQFKMDSSMWVETLFNTTAVSNSYPDELTFASYGLSTNLQSKGSSRNYIAWRDAVNAARLAIIVGIQGGNPIPTQSQFLALMPAIPSNPQPFTPVDIISMKTIMISATGTYTPSAGMVYCSVRGVGGGGGGGNAAGGTLGGAAGGGGGSGGLGMGTFTAAQIGASVAVTIGAGGASASAGGQTKFGSLLTCNGGQAGTSSANILLALATSLGGAAATSGAGGYLNMPGTPGGTSTINGVVIAGISGFGASSFYGGGGVARNTAGAGAAGNAYGAGGAGAFATTASQVGGAGSAGCIEITEFLTQ